MIDLSNQVGEMTARYLRFEKRECGRGARSMSNGQGEKSL